MPEIGKFLGEAQRLALLAGRELMRHRQQATVHAESKGQRRELVTAADRAAEQIVVGGLMAAFPEHGVLAEEGVLTTQGVASKDAEWVWIVDPLDGTTNFVHGLPHFAVAIALAHRGVPVVGVVHAPALGETFVGARGRGARRLFADGREQVLKVSTTAAFADALLATGFSYVRNEPGRDDNSGHVAAILPHCRDLRRLGSAELDLCYVAAGVFDGYWELYLAPYDTAAGSVLVREAGGLVTDWQGGENWLFGQQVVASNGLLHGELLHKLSARTSVASPRTTVTLFRPVGPQEMALIEQSGNRAFPPRLPGQPIFYPVTNEAYAVQIARDWNVKESGAGFVTRVAVDAAFVARYQRHVVGGAEHEELWVPAEDLPEFNRNIVGEIEVIRRFPEGAVPTAAGS